MAARYTATLVCDDCGATAADRTVTHRDLVYAVGNERPAMHTIKHYDTPEGWEVAGMAPGRPAVVVQAVAIDAIGDSLQEIATKTQCAQPAIFCGVCKAKRRPQLIHAGQG